MTAPNANEVRERRKRRRRILRWIPSAILAVGIVVVVIFTLSFNGSWWRQSNPTASAQQQLHGQSIFTQAGIDYSAKTGAVKISLAADRPSARSLGLPSNGSRTVSYIVPVTISVLAARDSVKQVLANRVRLHTEDGRISKVNLLYDGSYSSLHETALNYIALAGDASDLDAFEAALQSSRDKFRDLQYTAAFKSAYEGILLQVKLAGTPSTVVLTIALTPAK